MVVPFADALERTGLCVGSIMEAWWLDEQSMTPAIEHNGCDVAFRVESVRAEQARHMPSHPDFEFHVPGCEQARPRGGALYRGWQARNGQPHVERANRRAVRM